ncbi:cationic peroxidase 1-like [Phalaenopsis equestris]|uniref:cationic peroxidase 1-like n=1 Tax=Phalaenopsis equestris TaxID=78828 RepID=UPI0009E4AD51|nr:cationic peroxidase 1-like [Phalaenopsis equestris]
MASKEISFAFSIIFILLISGFVSAQLSTNFYASSCPQALQIIKSTVNAAVNNEKRMGASLLRLHFHDCFVDGCDGSILLDDTPTFLGEKTAFPNVNSVRGFDVIDTIKANVENACPQVVSCADIVAVAARDSVVALGGPYWSVPLGRRDSLTANFSQANTDLPAPQSNLTRLISAFAKKGLNANEMVALSGAHTIGQARCISYRNRIYNDTNIDSSFASTLKVNCSISSTDDNNLAPLDTVTPTNFDNYYYKNLLVEKGLLHSDQELYNGNFTDAQVNFYAHNSGKFFKDFSNAIIKMGNISPLTGTQGEIRLNCRRIN